MGNSMRKRGVLGDTDQSWRSDYLYNAITHIPLHHINLSKSLVAAAPPDAGAIRTT